MSITLRARSLAIAISLVCGGFAFACPQWTQDFAQQVWSGFGGGDEAITDNRNIHDLDLAGKRVVKRIELRGYVIHNLIAGRIELEEAAEQFENLNQIEPEVTSQVRIQFKGADDREKTARQVIEFARIALEAHPSRQVSVLESLELRLQVMKGRQAAESVH
jgi:hypothetical protein